MSRKEVMPVALVTLIFKSETPPRARTWRISKEVESNSNIVVAFEPDRGGVVRVWVPSHLTEEICEKIGKKDGWGPGYQIQGCQLIYVRSSVDSFHAEEVAKFLRGKGF